MIRIPDSPGDDISAVAASESGEQGQRAEGGAGSRPRAGSPAGFSACMLPSCGGPARTSQELWGTPPTPHWDPLLARAPLAPGCRPNRAQMALAEGLASLPHPGGPSVRPGWEGR